MGWLTVGPAAAGTCFSIDDGDIVSEVIQVEIPTVGESISEVQIGRWLKAEGDWVAENEDLVEIETEKASVQIPSPGSGILQNIAKGDEAFATVGEVIAEIRVAEKPAGGASLNDPAPAAKAPPSGGASATPQPGQASSSPIVMPAAQRLLAEHGLRAESVPASGPGGRLLKEDVLAYLDQRSGSPASAQPAAAPPASLAPPARPMSSGMLVTDSSPHRGEEVKPLSMLRRTIASRLVEAQQTAATADDVQRN